MQRLLKGWGKPVGLSNGKNARLKDLPFQFYGSNVAVSMTVEEQAFRPAFRSNKKKGL
jgi:hypothetical protein